jgi:glycylpeptide N-tetradecanoyltransferase
MTERPASDEDRQRIAGIIEALKQQSINISANATITNEADPDASTTHAFWDTQPMFLGDLNGNSNANASGNANGNKRLIQSTSKASASASASQEQLHAPLIPDKPIAELRQTPYNMPKGFEWTELDITKEDELEQVYDLLHKNYVEDDDCMFRFDYSHEFLKWALTPPGFQKSFHLGVRSSKGALVGFISAIPATIRSYETTFQSVEINFLCVHKKLRSKRLAPVLIKEITRRVNHTGVFQAVYTAGIVLPGPVSSCRYHHRTLSPKKLVEVGFTRVPAKVTMARFQKNYKLASETSTPGLRMMELKDVPSACRLLKTHLDEFKLVVEFSNEDFEHWFLPRKEVITSYVVVNDEGEVTDMVSYYHLHSTIQQNPKHTSLRAAYSFYNVATTVDLEDLMRDALILANGEDMDVFNALEQMKNKEFFDALKFGRGDGNLQYYLYNWCCPTMQPKDIGMVLL